MVCRSYPDMSRALTAGLSDEINALDPRGYIVQTGLAPFGSRPGRKPQFEPF